MSTLIQSSIAVVGFPATPEELDAFLYIDEASGEVVGGETDIDLLLSTSRGEGGGVEWSAPRWMTQGDVLFFYHAKSARQKISRLRKQATAIARDYAARPQPARPDHEANARSVAEVVRLLEHATELSDRFSGRIFACAEVSGPAGYQKTGPSRHFAGRSFVPSTRVHVFEHPLEARDLARFVKITRATPNTPLYERQFEGVKGLLARRNALPDFLQNARIGGTTFRDVDKNNWPEISCSPEVRFVNEEQVRSYLLDFLLEELKDPGTPLLRECRCLRGGKGTGFADYFVRIGGDWVPVEAKLSTLSVPEHKLLEQVARYVGIDSFSPTLGAKAGEEHEVAPGAAPVCLLADHAGIYLVSNGRFRGCSPGEPVWRRENLNRCAVRQVRLGIESAIA